MSKVLAPVYRSLNTVLTLLTALPLRTSIELAEFVLTLLNPLSLLNRIGPAEPH
jgi:hypothetical protein